MSKPPKKRRRTCIVSGCQQTRKPGQVGCATHSHQAALQAEIERLQRRNPAGWNRVAASIPELWDLYDVLCDMLFRADPSKARQLAPSRSAGHADGIVGFGRLHDEDTPPEQRGPKDYRATFATAADTLPDRQTLDWARRRIARLARDLADSGDRDRPRVEKPRCRSRNCPKPNVRQDPDQTHCGYCGRVLRRGAELEVAESA